MRNLSVFVSTLALFAVGPALAQTMPGAQTEANKALIRKAFLALEQGDLATLNQVYDPNGLVHTGAGAVPQGGPYKELKDTCGLCTVLNPRKLTIELMLAEGDLVAVRSSWSGKYSGTYKGVPVTGKAVTMVYTNIYRIADGRIAENWPIIDRLALGDALGIKLVAAEPGATPH